MNESGAVITLPADRRTAAKAAISNRTFPLFRCIGVRPGQTRVTGQLISGQSRQRAILYAKEFVIGCVGLFVIDIAWRLMDNFIDYWVLVHFSGLNWFIGDK